MRDIDIPPRIPLPWGVNSDPAFINDIPKDSQIGIVNGKASWATGFPPLSFVARSAGGFGPFGKDFQGGLKQISAGLQWLQAGGPMYYDSTFSSEIGGYPNGAILASNVAIGLLWLSIADNNTTNPDTGGSNWVPFNPRLLYQSFPLALFASGPQVINYVVPEGVHSIFGLVVGAGGSGASCNTNFTGGGGAGGGYAMGRFPTTPGATIVITIGGPGLATANIDGGNGGTTSVGSFLTATGGTGGVSVGGAGGGTAGVGSVSGLIGGGWFDYGGEGGNGTDQPNGLFAGHGGGSYFGGGGRAVTVSSGGSSSLRAACGSGGGGSYTGAGVVAENGSSGGVQLFP